MKFLQQTTCAAGRNVDVRSKIGLNATRAVNKENRIPGFHSALGHMNGYVTGYARAGTGMAVADISDETWQENPYQKGDLYVTQRENIQGFKLHASNGEIGAVKELYFDDNAWAVRYLVVDTGSWLSGRQVLISPHAVDAVSKEDRRIDVGLTKHQIENSPGIDAHKPVARQQEADYHTYYGYPNYWNGPYLWEVAPYPSLAPHSPQADTVAREIDAIRERQNSEDRNLRSTKEVTGYYVEASDGDIGHVEDFVVDDQSWAIRYVAVDTHNWLPGKKVVISPEWLQSISWDDSKIHVDVLREAIKNAPEYDEFAVNREYESRLYGHYGREGYWHDDRR